MTIKPKVYLCGRISKLEYHEAIGWRNQVCRELQEHFEVLDPMRDKKELVGKHLEGAYPEYLLCRHDMIMLRDSFDVERSDALLVYVHPKLGLGRFSYIEIGIGVALHKLIVVVDETKYLAEHAAFKTMPRIAYINCFTDAFLILRSLFNV